MSISVESKVSASLGILKRIEVDVARIGDLVSPATVDVNVNKEMVRVHLQKIAHLH